MGRKVKRDPVRSGFNFHVKTGEQRQFSGIPGLWLVRPEESLFSLLDDFQMTRSVLFTPQ